MITGQASNLPLWSSTSSFRAQVSTEACCSLRLVSSASSKKHLCFVGTTAALVLLGEVHHFDREMGDRALSLKTQNQHVLQPVETKENSPDPNTSELVANIWGRRVGRVDLIRETLYVRPAWSKRLSMCRRPRVIADLCFAETPTS